MKEIGNEEYKKILGDNMGNGGSKILISVLPLLFCHFVEIAHYFPPLVLIQYDRE